MSSLNRSTTTLILNNPSSNLLCVFFETTCSQVQKELYRRAGVLWMRIKWKPLISPAQRKLKHQDNLGGLNWWLISKSVSSCCLSLFPAVFPKEVKSLSSAGHGTVILCSVGNACSPTVLGWWCFFLPYKSLVSWDAWLGRVESTGSRAPLCVCSEGFAARMPTQFASSFLFQQSTQRSKCIKNTSSPFSLFMASEEAFWAKFPTFSWIQSKLRHCIDQTQP